MNERKCTIANIPVSKKMKKLSCKKETRGINCTGENHSSAALSRLFTGSHNRKTRDFSYCTMETNINRVSMKTDSQSPSKALLTTFHAWPLPIHRQPTVCPEQ